MPALTRRRTIQIKKHEAVPDCGSFEVRFPDGRDSVYFYWDDIASRRLRPEQVDRETALDQAKALARAATGKIGDRHDLPALRWNALGLRDPS